MDAPTARWIDRMGRTLARRFPRGLAGTTILLLSSCVGTPRVAGVPAASPAPQVPWTPPAAITRPIHPADTAARAALPAGLAARITRLTLAEIVDLGLSNNAATRLAWANAQTAAATYGSERGAWLPTLDADVSASRIKTVATSGRISVEQSVLTPSLTLSYLLLDFGGRTGRIEGAQQRLYSAGFTHNATIQSVVLQIEVAYFQYLASRSLLGAQRTSLEEAQANLAAAEERRRVGVATIADVLQARTAASQAQLNLQTTEGDLQTARGALALSLGLPANLPYDVDSTAAAVPVAALTDSVNALIATALQGRPDLAAARAEAEAARAGISESRANLLPSLNLSATGGRTYAGSIPNGANSYNVSLGLSIPLFNGFSRQYDVRAARFQAEAASAQTESLRQQVVYQVFSSYYALQTATRRVRTAEDLVASAQQSNEVALGRYKGGVGSVLDLLQAQTALAGARAQHVDARLAWSVALAQLAHDSGVLDPRGGNPLRLTTDTTGREPR
jgi:TolC family type I secretion outer membrane protein